MNCADATLTDMALLHDRLQRQFIGMRLHLVNERCGGEFVWPKDRPFIAFQPPAPAVVPRWKARVVDLSIAAMLAVIAWGFYEFVMR